MKDLLNCPNCGAPIVDDRCAYCGSVFLDICNVEPGTLVYLKFHTRRDTVAYARARVVTLRFDLSPSAPMDMAIELDLRGDMDKQGRVIIYKEDLPHA